LVETEHGRRYRWSLSGAALLVALTLTAGCETDDDPRTGDFFDGLENVATGGYEDFVEEKQNELDATRDQSVVLAVRAEAIQVERDALNRELESLDGDLRLLRARLADLRAALGSTRQATEDERRKLEDAERKTQLATTRFARYRQGPTPSIEAAREEVDDLRKLIGTIGTMVSELSG
jgi:chromosome segregation ATPase